MVDDNLGRDTTDQSVQYNPGDTQARDINGNFVPVPEPRIPVNGPSVDKEELTSDNGETEKLVDQQAENAETGENNDPAATDDTNDDSADSSDDDTDGGDDEDNTDDTSGGVATG